MKFAHSGSVLVAVSALLGCAGGGGGNSGGASGPVTSTLSFPLQTGLANSVKNGSSVNFTVSGDCNGTASIIDALPASATFEGNAVQSALTTITLNLTNCVPLVSSSATTNYYDASFLPLGSITNSSYGLFLTPPSIPTSVKVGYTGTIGSQTLYLDRGKTVQVGTSVTSYVVEPDTINSAIINLVTKSYDSNTVLTLTEQDRYRILADGTMTAVSSDIQYSNSSTVHLLLTAATSATSPILGGWGVPSLVSNDLIFSVSDMQLAGDGVGNMFLAARWGTISPSKVGVAVFQKPLGLGWGAQFEISPIKTISVPPYVSNFIKPQIRADSAGNAVATWIDMDNSSLSDRGFLSNLYVQNYDKVNGWSLPILMQSDPTEYVISDNLTVQADGTAWVVWTERTYKDPFFSVLDKFALFAAKYTPLVGWGAAEKVTADYAITPLSGSYPAGRITTDNNGNPTILWTDGLTLYATRRTAGVWGSSDVVVAFLSTPGVANVINDFDIAVDGSGNAIAVWQRWDSTGLIKTVYSNRYVANTGWTGVTAMSNLFFQNADAVSPKLAMDSSGNAFLLWSQYDGFLLAIWSARFDHILGWQTPATISSSSQLVESPQIGVDKLGNAVAIWSQYDAFFNKTLIRACRYDINTGWGKDRFISNGNGVVHYPQLAVSEDGHATALWAQDDVGNESNKMWSNDFAP